MDECLGEALVGLETFALKLRNNVLRDISGAPLARQLRAKFGFTVLAARKPADGPVARLRDIAFCRASVQASASSAASSSTSAAAMGAFVNALARI